MFKSILVGMVILGMFVVVGTMETNNAKADTTNVCELSYQVIDGELERKCEVFIASVEASGQYKVVESNGKFNIEKR